MSEKDIARVIVNLMAFVSITHSVPLFSSLALVILSANAEIFLLVNKILKLQTHTQIHVYLLADLQHPIYGTQIRKIEMLREACLLVKRMLICMYNFI